MVRDRVARAAILRWWEVRESFPRVRLALGAAIPEWGLRTFPCTFLSDSISRQGITIVIPYRFYQNCLLIV